MTQTSMTPLLPTPHQQVFAVVCAAGLLAVILFLVRRRTIREEYAILWLITGLAILVLAASRPLLLLLIKVSGVALASSILFLAAIFFIILMLIHLTAVVSDQRRTIKDLAIRVALLDEARREESERG